MTPLEWVLTFLGPFLGLCAMSYIFFGDTYFFSTAECIYTAGILAYSVFATWETVLTSGFIKIMQGRVALVIPIVLGFLAFSRLTRFRWLARYQVAALAGLGVGLTFGLTLRGQLLAGVTSTVADTISRSPTWYDATLKLVGFLAVMTYFMYTVKFSGFLHTTTGWPRYIVRIGRLFMMASFGQLFGMGGAPVTQLQIFFQRTIQAILYDIPP